MITPRKLVVTPHRPLQNAFITGARAGSNLVRLFLVRAHFGWCPGELRGALGCLVALGGRAASQEPNIDRSPVPDSPAAAAIDQLRLSDALADFGEHNADPIALVEAAKIRKMLPAPLNGSNEAPSDR